MSGAHGARRAVAYIRLAQNRLAPATPVHEAQRNAIDTWAAREGVDVASWQVDVGVEGATPIAERPGLLAAYRALADHRAGMLVAANAEQFSLDELVSWLIERAAWMQGATIHTADGSRGPARSDVDARRSKPEPDDAGYTRGALALARAHQQVTLRVRIRASLAERKARGQRIGNIPYGYRLAADGLHLEPDEAEQAVVTTIRRLAGEGLSQRAIVTQLAARGVAGRTGAPLGQTQVAKILRSAS